LKGPEAGKQKTSRLTAVIAKQQQQAADALR